MKKELQFYQREYERSRISRREFLGRASALGLTAASAGTLLTASNQVIGDVPTKGDTDLPSV